MLASLLEDVSVRRGSVAVVGGGIRMNLRILIRISPAARVDPSHSFAAKPRLGPLRERPQ